MPQVWAEQLTTSGEDTNNQTPSNIGPTTGTLFQAISLEPGPQGTLPHSPMHMHICLCGPLSPPTTSSPYRGTWEAGRKPSQHSCQPSWDQSTAGQLLSPQLTRGTAPVQTVPELDRGEGSERRKTESWGHNRAEGWGRGHLLDGLWVTSFIPLSLRLKGA